LNDVYHSTVLLKQVTCPSEAPVCIHGTYWKAWQLIKAGGLSKMKRNHIHFAMGMPDFAVGMSSVA
jgi:2'-phosphotransferase